MAVHVPGIFAYIAAQVDTVLSTRDVDPFHVYFDYGHYTEIGRNLSRKQADQASQGKRYPLIWLVMDFEELYDDTITDICTLPALQLFIVTETEPALSTEERMQKNFFPRLYPIYDELMNQLGNSGLFTCGDPDSIKHRRIVRPYWGGQDAIGNSVTKLFPDFVDAIQIRELNLEVDIPNCEQTILLTNNQ